MRPGLGYRTLPEAIPRLRRFGAVAVILASALALSPLGASAQSDVPSDLTADRGADTPTFYADVLPIAYENCASCHQPAGLNMGGMVAPFSFLDYEDARPWAPLIAEAVRSGRMPPWSAAEMHRGTFENERFLEDDEKATLIAWAAGGAPAGDPAHAPELPETIVRAQENAGGWFLGEPDLILSFDEPYCMPDDLEDIYVDIPVRITEDMLPEDRWIESVEYRNGPAVHHIISSVASLVPGAEPTMYDEGYGRLMRAGPREVEFQMHFNKPAGPGTGLCTDIQAGVRFKQPGEVIRRVTGGESLMMPGIRIPAGESSYSASREYTFDEDVELLSLMPHMHLRGKAALYELTYPDGRHETLLHVPDYDFNWQHSYDFREPRFVPAGSVLRFTLWWDNSEDNRHNPDPTVDVRWGRPTSAEMSQGYMSFQTMEERNIVVGEPLIGEVPENRNPEEIELPLDSTTIPPAPADPVAVPTATRD